MPKQIVNKSTNPERYKRDQDYIKNNIKFVAVPFNQTKPEDKELYDWLRSIGGRKRTAYIKQLIREDMEKGGE